ncbi:MAG TPA: DUF4130 domain-containing protein [Candidatus Lokiarchaeia archaeon]|nr:DUF4130 domain-containing protein [Candidatus Lokiarchaeia archaeon]
MKARTVNAIDKIISHARRHNDLLRYPAAYFARYKQGISTINELRLHHPDIIKKARAVEIAVYKIKGYMRLVPFDDLLAGVYKSEHVLSDLVGLHFAKRYPACHVMTWNETRREGCFTFSGAERSNNAVLGLLSSHPVMMAVSRGLLIQGGSHHFALPRQESFRDFVASLAALLYPEKYGNKIALFDKQEFAEEWKAFYDTQVIDSRINYQRAMKMLGKKHLLDQLGQDSIEAQRVLKKVPKGQKPLF